MPPSATPHPWLPDVRADVIGADARLATLVPLLESGTLPWVIGMVGVGGIGKSALARAVVETLRLTGTYPMIVWVQSPSSVTARWETTSGVEEREALTVSRLIETIAVQVLGEDAITTPDTRRYLETALRERFRETPHLLVLDNVESIPSFPEVLRLLQGWVKPGKVLLLSRTQRWHTHQVVTYRVPPLNAEETIAFIRQEAQAHHFTALLTCAPEVLVSLYELVGGHPLALRLLTAHIEQYGIGPSLRRFREAKGIGRDLYDFVYTETWQGLSDTIRQVAIALLLTAEEGGTVHDIGDATGMEEDDILDALEHLIAHNWVDIGGDALLRYYTLHRLTRLFVQQQIAS